MYAVFKDFKVKLQPAQEQRILAQVRRICASNRFRTKPRQRDILIFLVKEAIAGRSDQIKSPVLATEVLKTTDDELARREVGRLRGELIRYYANDDEPDPLRIKMQTTGYRLTFSSLDVLLPGANDVPPQETPTTFVAPSQTVADDLHIYEPRPTVDLPRWIPLARWRSHLIVIGTTIVLASAGLVVLSKMRSPKLPADVLGL